MKRRDVLKGGLAFSAAAVAAPYVKAQAQITLHGASQFNDDHAFTKALAKFAGADAAVLRQADQLRPAQELASSGSRRTISPT